MQLLISAKIEPSAAPGLAFVALSRCKSIEHYLFIDWTPKRLNMIQNHTHFARRMLELNRLEYLFQQTRYNFDGTPMNFDNLIDITKYEKKLAATGTKPATIIQQRTRKRLACEPPTSKPKRKKRKVSQKRKYLRKPCELSTASGNIIFEES